ncbi:MAG: TonB C-terminal domain-containing protein [Candidatus Gastranaerophilales bacterium]|nr:TonB C-terminal domain-containing protein [Candidatus Gastranaerophilales bacterium]
MFKKVLILLSILFYSISAVCAECWINTTPNDNNPVYIDIDNIYKTGSGTFFNVKYYVESSQGEVVFTIHSNANKAGISQSCVYSKYEQNKCSMDTRNAKPATKFKTITSESKIYNAYKVTTLTMYKLETLRQNPNNIYSLLSSKSTPFAVAPPGTGAKRYASAPSSPSKGTGCSAGTGNPGGGCSSVGAVKEPDFGPYMRDLQKRIKANWTPPKGNESKKVVLLFKIAKNGNLLSCRVHKSSGVSAVDQAALNAVKITAPFRPLPSEYKGESVDIQFTFDYKVFGSSKY